MNKGLLILITGKSASGKDTVQKFLCENFKYNAVPKYTTRPQREGETQGNPYIFVDKETFFKMQDENKSMLVSEFRGWYYGFSWKDIDNIENPLMVVDNVQLAYIVKNCVQRPVIICLNRTCTDRYISQLERGTLLSEVYRRAIHDDGAFQVLLNDDNVYKVDNNRSIEEVVYDILQIIAKEADILQGECDVCT